MKLPSAKFASRLYESFRSFEESEVADQMASFGFRPTEFSLGFRLWHAARELGKEEFERRVMQSTLPCVLSSYERMLLEIAARTNGN